MFGFNPYKLENENISLALIQRYINDVHPRRTCLSVSQHIHNYFFNPPFKKAIEAFFYSEFKKKFGINKNGKYYVKCGGYDLNQIISWVNKYQNVIFINDALPLSLVLSFYKRKDADGWKYTKLGNIVNAIKYRKDFSRLSYITETAAYAISSFPYYKDADCICAIPPSQGKDFDLPSHIASDLSSKVSKQNISQFVVAGNKKQLKQTPLDDKITELFNWDVSINTDIRGKKIILIDDLYQSGATMMYIAMKLQTAGASAVYGLSMVKNLTNSDNCKEGEKYE